MLLYIYFVYPATTCMLHQISRLFFPTVLAYVARSQQKNFQILVSMYLAKQLYIVLLRSISTLACVYQVKTPATYFKKKICPTKSINEQHQIWINNMRDNIWSRTKFENQMIPSNEALYLHWQKNMLGTTHVESG